MKLERSKLERSKLKRSKLKSPGCQLESTNEVGKFNIYDNDNMRNNFSS